MNYTHLNKVTAVTMVGTAFLLMVLSGPSFAQNLGGLSQFLGGGQKHSSSSSKSSNAVTVQRDATPYIGTFDGKQKEGGANLSLSAEFACYPAHDSALPQSNTFVCYTAGTSSTGGK